MREPLYLSFETQAPKTYQSERIHTVIAIIFAAVFVGSISSIAYVVVSNWDNIKALAGQ